ncbi:MAG: MATE family efflux transporter [Waltera sp.]
MCNGAGLVVAQCFGCGNKERLAKTVTALIWVAGVLTCIMSLIGIFGAEFFLRLLSVPENVIGYSATYLHIIYTFVFGSVVYNGCAAILNSVGDSKTPLRAVIASSVVNIVFDLFFIIVCKMGVAGAAYATILAQCTSAVICFVKVRQVREEIGLSLMKWKPEVHYIQLVVKTGFPAAFQSCMIALGGMSVQRLVNSSDLYHGGHDGERIVTAWRSRSLSPSNGIVRYLLGRTLRRINTRPIRKLSIRRWRSWWEPASVLLTHGADLPGSAVMTPVPGCNESAEPPSASAAPI